MPWPWSSAPTGGDEGSSNSAPPDGITQLNDAVYLLSEPEGGVPDMELVFIHGLQLSDYRDAYWKTWTVGKNDRVCWPMAWLKEDFPGARIFSLSYDSSAIKTSNTGTMDVFLAGESLVQNMVGLANIGQGNCPVVFVCHSLGGLVVKQIVLNAYHKFGEEPKYVNFLNNIGGFHFYATPHSGSKLADLALLLPTWKKKGPMVQVLKVINDALGRLNEEFDRFCRSDKYSNKNWKFAVVAETHLTSYGTFNAKVVEEMSARHMYNKFLSVPADHFGVCKPESKKSGGYLSLKSFIEEEVMVGKRFRVAEMNLM